MVSRRFPSHPVWLLLTAAMLLTACSTLQPIPTWTPAPEQPTATPTPEPTATATPLSEDVHEPNNSMLEASGPLIPGEEYQGFIAAKDDIDFFYLEIDAPQIVELSLTQIPSDADYDLYLVTREEDLLADSSQSGPQDEHIRYATSSVGVFYVVVLPFDNFSDKEPYSLRMVLAPAPTPSGQDSYEPNDTFAQAAGPLSLGQPYQSYIWDEGDVDVYSFQIDQFLSVTIRLTDITAVADYDLFLYNVAEELLASSELMIDHETVQRGISPGTYYVVVRSVSGFSQNDPYSLQIDIGGG